MIQSCRHKRVGTKVWVAEGALERERDKEKGKRERERVERSNNFLCMLSVGNIKFRIWGSYVLRITSKQHNIIEWKWDQTLRRWGCRMEEWEQPATFWVLYKQIKKAHTYTHRNSNTLHRALTKIKYKLSRNLHLAVRRRTASLSNKHFHRSNYFSMVFI